MRQAAKGCLIRKTLAHGDAADGCAT